MWNPFRVGGFEKRLVASFLLLSVAPTVLIAFFSARYFMRSVELVSNPAVEQSFTNSMEIARDFSAKLEKNARATALRLADEAAKSEATGTGANLRPALAKVRVEADADFTALYTLEGGAWKLRASNPEGFPRIDSELAPDAVTQPGSAAGAPSAGTGAPSAAASGQESTAMRASHRIGFADQDVIASGVAEGGRLLVAGFALERGFNEKMRKTGDDLGRYRAVGLYVSVLRRYIIIMTSVVVAILFIASTVISRMLAQRISHPIKELARATERIAQGDLEHRVTVQAQYEIGSLVAGFNKMTGDLAENKRNLIEMARREAQVARDFEIARQVQASLFPKALPAARGCEFAATCRTAKVVGGDYYDIFEVAPGKMLFSQGDVSGKGIGASLTMASVHAIIRSLGDSLGDAPGKLIAQVNHYLVSSRTPEMFVTLFLGLIDCGSGVVRYVNCGHPPAMVVRAHGGRLEELRVGGMVLGVKEQVAFEIGESNLAAGDTLVLVSDGVTEAKNPSEQLFGEQGFEEILRQGQGLNAAATLERILTSVEDFMQGAEQADDMSIMVVRRATVAGCETAGSQAERI